jgi:hypothetical protein
MTFEVRERSGQDKEAAARLAARRSRPSARIRAAFAVERVQTGKGHQLGATFTGTCS